MRRDLKGIIITIAVLMTLWLTVVVNAEAKEVFPAKPINIIVPQAPGGSLDVAARTLAVYMGQYLKTSIVISNISGASGLIGYTKGYTAKPDGYTLVCWYSVSPLLMEYEREVGYRTLGFTPIAGISRDFPMLVVHPEGSKDILDFAKHAKEHVVTIGRNGRATLIGLQAKLMTVELDMRASWVNYGGASQSLTALAGKHLDAVATHTDSAMPLIKAGKIIPLLVFTKTRHPKFPTVPIPSELGFKFPLLSSYFAIVGPPGMDKERVEILENVIMKAAAHPDYVAWSGKVSTAQPALASAKEYKAEIESFAKVVQSYRGYLTSD